MSEGVEATPGNTRLDLAELGEIADRVLELGMACFSSSPNRLCAMGLADQVAELIREHHLGTAGEDGPAGARRASAA
jgi:hypothetical protein